MHVCMYACMHICMYACMHVCMYACMHVCMYACMHVCMYACMHVCMYACMHVCMYACMHVCMYACMYVCMYVCMYGYMCVCVCICVCACVQMHTYTYVCMCTRTYVPKCRCSFVNMCACVQALFLVCIYVKVYIYVYIYIYMHIDLCSCIYVSACIRVYMQSHAHGKNSRVCVCHIVCGFSYKSMLTSGFSHASLLFCLSLSLSRVPLMCAANCKVGQLVSESRQKQAHDDVLVEQGHPCSTAFPALLWHKHVFSPAGPRPRTGPVRDAPAHADILSAKPTALCRNSFVVSLKNQFKMTALVGAAFRYAAYPADQGQGVVP